MASIEYRGISKRTMQHSYRVVVSAGYEADGKQKKVQRLYHYPDTMKEKTRLDAVKKEAAKLEVQLQSGTISAGRNLKLSEFSEYFLNNHCRSKLSPTTVSSYEDMLKQRIIPAMGTKRLSQIRPAEINSFIAGLEETGKTARGDKLLSPRTIRNHFMCLSSMFQQAVYWEFIASNPCKKVKAPRSQHEERRFLSDEQVILILEELVHEDIKYQAIAQIAIYSGQRRGEIVGLHWNDIDFDENTISVNRSRKYLRGIGYTDKETKTKSAIRTNSLPASVFETLKALQADQKNKKEILQDLWIEDPHVFKQWNGKPMSDDAPYHWFLKFIKKIRSKQIEAAERAGKTIEDKDLFPMIRFHDLRHANATLLIAEGVDIQTVKKRLGHAQASTTMNMYGHALDERDKKATIKLENLLVKNKQSPSNPQDNKTEQS